ncbi:MAG: DUF3795 domain-containing protein [Promethearchaeota archaeon]
MVNVYKIPTSCGLICDACPWYQGKKETKCIGCLESAGKPFWGDCEISRCASEKNVEHCGACQEFPCETLNKHFDPNNPKGPQEAIFRIGQLAIRRKIGTKKWLENRRNGVLPDFES